MTKLYVANVPVETDELELRRHFATCGGVADVELLTDRNSGKPRGLARVTMTSPSFAEEAVRKLDGAPFNGVNLRVSETPIKADAPVKSKVKIVQQYRERGNMTYELDCNGTPLLVCIVQDDGEQWRIEASTKPTGGEPPTPMGVGVAKTKSDALEEALRSCPVDAVAVVVAMRDVRAI